ncbi:MAG: hypothetical protein ACI4J1_01175 [Ruminiclostridium sp.]
MKRDEKFWDEALERLDEKYINEAAEKLAENDIIKSQQKPPLIVKIPQKKSRLGTILGVCAGAAAAVCFVAIGVIFAGRQGVVIEPTLTSITELGNVISPETTKPKLEGSTKSFKSIYTFKSTDEEMMLNYYEDRFIGEWTEISTGEKLTLSYKSDCVSLGDVFCGFKGGGGGVFMKNIAGGDCNNFYFISSDEPDILYYYSDNSDVIEYGSYKSVYVRTNKLENERKLSTGELGAIGVIKLTQKVEETDIYSHSDNMGAIRTAIAKRLVLPDGQTYTNCYGNTDMYFELVSLENDKLSFRCNYKPTDGEKTVPVTIKMKCTKGHWQVSSAATDDGEEITFLTDKDDSMLPKALFSGNIEMDFDIFEEHFYGLWTGISDSGVEYELPLTYHKDCFGDPFNWSMCCTGFYSDEQGYYMMGINGGIGQCWYIPAYEPNRLYCYKDVGEPVKCSDYSFVYERSAPVTSYDRDVLSTTAEISSLGLKRLEQLIGFVVPKEVSEIIIDGEEWTRDTNLSLGFGNVYINQRVTEDKVVLTRRYFLKETYSEDDYSSTPEMQYITLTMEKKDDKWHLSSAEKYRSNITSFNTPAYTEVEKACEKINEELGNNGSEACTVEQNISYFTTKDGFYYAVRQIKPSMAEEPSYTEVYYFNGTDYTAIGTEYTQEDYSIGKLLDLKFVGESLYVHTSNDGANYVYRCIDGAMELLIMQDGGDMDISFIGDKYMIYRTDNTYMIYDIALTCRMLFDFDTVNNVIDEDGMGFTAIVNGETLHIRANPKEMSLEEQLKLLDMNAQYIWIYTQIESPLVDYNSDNLLYDDGAVVKLYPVTQEDFRDYNTVYSLLSSVYTKSCTEKILSEELPTGMVFYGGKTYCNGGARGSNLSVGRIEYKIKSQDESTAELEYTVYGVNPETSEQTDEILETYTIKAVNTENGWRLDKYYLPY